MYLEEEGVINTHKSTHYTCIDYKYILKKLFCVKKLKYVHILIHYFLQQISINVSKKFNWLFKIVFRCHTSTWSLDDSNEQRLTCYANKLTCKRSFFSDKNVHAITKFWLFSIVSTIFCTLKRFDDKKVFLALYCMCSSLFSLFD